MYTPQEVSEKTFPKSTGLTSGYNMTAVDEFLDGLTEDYTALYKDNTTLKAKLKMLAEKVEEYRATEDAMRSTLLAAQKMAAQMVADAQAEKEKTIADAQAQAEQILADARGEADVQARQLQQEIRDSWEKLATAQSETEDFIQRSRDLCAQQLAFLDSLPERNAPEQEDQEPENEDPARPGGERRARGGRGACFPGGGPPAGVCRRTGAAAGVSGEERGGVSLPPGFQAESGGPAVWPQLQRRRPAVNHSVKSGPAAAFALSARRWQYDAHRGPAV